jgi:Family of unknown function (DUF695)
MGSHIPPRDIWATATGDERGTPVIYRYRQNHTADPSRYPHALRIVWPYDGQVRNGMPPVEDNKLQVGFEDAIGTLGEGRAGYLMLVLTGNGRKEWLYYVEDPKRWLEELNRSLATHKPYPLQIGDWLDEGWSTWQKFADSVTGS